MQAEGPKREFRKVLLIDDDEVAREVMAAVLAMAGYAVETACGGAAALELLDAGEHDPDVILMDTQMPGLCGIRLIEELRASSRAILYAISASNVPDGVAACADGFLQKPLDPDALRTLLDGDATLVESAAAQQPPTAHVEEQIVDLNTLNQLRALMPESAVREIYAAIVTDLHKRIAALELAIVVGDAARVRSIGHAIKGGCAMAGAVQAARLGALLESGELEVDSNHLDNSTAVVLELSIATGNLEGMLETGLPE